jgi:FkbM family methyltransferase
MNTRCFWFDEPGLVSQFPRRYRAYARYSRAVANRETGIVRGGSFLFSAMKRLNRLLKLCSIVEVSTGSVIVNLDLNDPRMSLVLSELCNESYEQKVIRRTVRPGDTFIDLGANHGSYSLLASTLVGESGLVISFEPQPKLAKLLERSLFATGSSAFEVLNIACTDSVAEAELFVPSDSSGSAGVYRSFSGTTKHETVRISCTTLDSVLAERALPGRVFVKLDVEGSEASVLRGASTTLSRYAPLILLELNPQSAAAAGYSVAELLQLLCGLGYKRFSELNEFPDTIAWSQVESNPQRNLLAIPDTYVAAF